MERDNLFVVEGITAPLLTTKLYILHFLPAILEKRIKKQEEEYLIKWENYEDPTWEPKTNIPEFITNYFDKTGQTKIPTARVSHTKIVGRKSMEMV